MLFLSSYTLVPSSTYKLIQYYTVPLSSPQPNFSQSYSSSAINHCFAGSSTSKHTNRYQYFTICPRYFPLVLPLTRSIKPSLILHSSRRACLRAWAFKRKDKFPQINTLYIHIGPREILVISFFCNVCN